MSDLVFETQEHSEKMRQTSRFSFDQIKAEGLLSKMRWRVYKYLFFNGPATGAEINRDLCKNGGREHYHKRVSELVRLGVVQEVGRRKCTVSGRIAIESNVVPGLPQKPKAKAPKPSDDDLRETLAEMRVYWREKTIAGTAPGSHFVHTMRWISDMVPPRCKTCDGTRHVLHLGGLQDSCPDCGES